MRIHSLFLALFAGFALKPSLAQSPSKAGTLFVAITNTVVVYRGGERIAATNGMDLRFGDEVQTDDKSRATIRWTDRTESQVSAMTTILIRGTNNLPVADLRKGAFRVFGRDRPDILRFQTDYAVGGPRNTEYEVRVEEGRAVVNVFEGAVEVTNKLGSAVPRGNEYTVIRSNEPPQLPRAIVATNLVQWWLHYPVVLDVSEFAAEERRQLTNSTAFWLQGDSRAPWQSLPKAFEPRNDFERAYLASLWLTVGETAKAESSLGHVSTHRIAAQGIRELIAAVTGQYIATNDPEKSASAWLGRSFWLQAQKLPTRERDAALRAARDAALRAVCLSPDFGFGWARVAELEFSVGNVEESRAAVERAIELVPKHAEAHAVRGFVLAAENRVKEASREFETARDLDPALGNAWLGLGLTKFRDFRDRDPLAGLAAIQRAVVLEPNRSLLRSYLGKAFAENGDSTRARAEIDSARQLDSLDPTPWLYSALEHHAHNRVNEAISDLEESLKRNDNRAVYRSQLLLDQDRAVRATSLARLYLRAGMLEVALREAAHAVSYDYGNPSAHLFLADSFNALRDPTRFNLRYETAWFNELLLANALAPVDSGILSPSLTHQEYTRLFARDGFFLSSFGEARSDGQFRQLATQSGVFGHSAYALDLDFQHNDGVRPNNDLERIEVYAQLKQQSSPKDTALLLTKFQEYTAGDNFQYRNPVNPRTHFQFDEKQEPIALGIWRHEWSPGHQTLALAGRLENDQRFRDIGITNKVLLGNAANPQSLLLDLAYRGHFETFVGELNHIAQFNCNTLVAGGRVQVGEFTTSDRLAGDATDSPFFGDTTAAGVFHDAAFSEEFSRISLYTYDTWQALEQLSLTAGLQYDTLDSPRNFRHPPISGGSVDQSRLLPKAALIWRPTDLLSIRAMFAQSPGGVSFDESYRLEPVQLAGFSQAFRTVIPESIVGSVSGHRLDLGGVALDVKLPTRTYLGAQATLTRSAVDRTVGLFDFDTSLTRQPPGQPAQTLERLRYEDKAVQLAANQMIRKNWSFGAKYEFHRTDLTTDLPILLFDTNERADLHGLRLQAVFNAENGLFAHLLSSWWRQKDKGDFAVEDQHTQMDLEFGRRFRRQRGDFSAGVMNLLDEDYGLAPLSVAPVLPRERVFFARLRLNL